MYLVCCLHCKLHVQSNSYVIVFTTGLTWLVIQDANISVIASLLRKKYAVYADFCGSVAHSGSFICETAIHAHALLASIRGIHELNHRSQMRVTWIVTVFFLLSPHFLQGVLVFAAFLFVYSQSLSKG